MKQNEAQDPDQTQTRPRNEAQRPTHVMFGGRQWPMRYEPTGWRLRSKAKGRKADCRTGTKNLAEAKRIAKEYLENQHPSAPKPTPQSSGPERTYILFDGWKWPLLCDPAGWRLRSKAKGRVADCRTGTRNLNEAKRIAKEYLEKRQTSPMHSRKGGGTLEALAAIYLASPKRTQERVGENNVSRLRVICRVLGRELGTVTCREVGPKFWQDYQRAALEAKGLKFDLVTRYRENIAINAAVRAARCLFLPAFLPAYRAAGLDLAPDAGQATTMPVPHLPPSEVDDAALVAAWETLAPFGGGESAVVRRMTHDLQLWLVVGLARFAGLRRDEICWLRGDWIEEWDGAISIVLRDRPEQKWWTKTGKPYRARVIEPRLVAWLDVARKSPGTYVVPDPSSGVERHYWILHEPQYWLREVAGVAAQKPLHRLRGLYADHIAKLAREFETVRLAGIRAAQANLGHTTSAVTEAHYLTPVR
jgi:hypothetical protein